MDLQELIPCPFAAFWTGVRALLFQDVLHRLPTDAADPELSKFFEYAGVTEACFLGDPPD